MADALSTVQDYVDRARVLLQDQVSPYRYTDDELVAALNLSILDARRLRPDLFLSTFASLPVFTSTGMSGQNVSIEQMYRVAFVYYIIGHAQLRDQEEGQDARATVFLNKFNSMLTTLA